jgi:cytidylate kinase
VKRRRDGLVITIDGPAGTGKSTVARMLARRLGVDFLDTGAMYRAAAVLAIEQGIDPGDGRVLAAALRRTGVRFDWSADPPVVLLGGRDVSSRIRDMDVSGIVSIVAAEPAVREFMVEEQRKIAADRPRLVSEGRDQGSVVFPRAPLRLYLDADVEVRAQRRAEQLRGAGKPVDRARIVSDIVERDRRDSTRGDGPLIRPEGAVVVDTTRRSAEEVVDELERISRDRLPEAGFTS